GLERMFLEGSNPYFPSKTPGKLPKSVCVGLLPSIMALAMNQPVYDGIDQFDHKLAGLIWFL
ncbi:hypothetical protein, partial [Actinobacillus pleuropneumoniae]